MEKYSLPLDLDKVAEVADMTIDMSELHFDVPPECQKKSAFVFLRNSGVKAELDFSNCNYEDKEEFLLMYLTENIEVDSEILSTTWIEILSARDGGKVYLPSILTSDEIHRFCGDHGDLISEAYQLINSLPIYAMLMFQGNHTIYNVDEFKKTDYDRIKMANFHKLSKYDPFILLIDGTTEPLFYTRLFIQGEYYITQMVNDLPFLNMLSAIFAPPPIQDEAIGKINQFLQPPVQTAQEGKDVTEG